MSETTTEATVPALDQIATALAAFQAEMPTVAKAHTATVKSDKGSYSYTYAGLADVSEAAMPLLAKHGLSFSCLPGGGVLTGMLLHSSGQSLTASLPINGATPQQVGSSLTYMRRYLLGCMTGLVTDDDDDGQLAQSTPKRKPAAKKAAPPPPEDEPMTAKTRGQMFALFGQKGIAEDAQLAGINRATGANYTSRADVTEAHAREVIAMLKQRPDVAPVAPEVTAEDAFDEPKGSDA
jgi:hypothetical protein